MIASLDIKAANRDKKTYLRSCYFTTPFKVANITEDKSLQQLHLMVMSSSPGILDGDDYQVKIELEKDCALQLHTQSYQRLFSMKQGAFQHMEVSMEENASFCYLPHPSVPHANANFISTNRIFLSDNCKLIWGEVITCGRKLSGEEFMFTRYQNRTEIFLGGKLVVKENLLIQPSIVDVAAIGQFEGFTHQASLIYIDKNALVNKLIAEVNLLFSNDDNMALGVSALPVNGIVIRLLGYQAEQLFICLQRIASLLSKSKVAQKD